MTPITYTGGSGGNHAFAPLGFLTLTRKVTLMYLTTGDMLAVMIALVVSVTLVITTALANARLTTSVKYWRDAYFLAEKDNQKAGM